MSIFLEQAIAREVLRLSDFKMSDNYSVLQNSTNQINIKVKNAIDDLLSHPNFKLTTMLENNTGDFKPLINLIFDNGIDNALMHKLIDALSTEEMNILTINQIDNLYDNCGDKYYFLNSIFSKGFDFKQGTFNEVDKALSFDFEFFESCLIHKKDFDFSFNYEKNKTLLDILVEESQYQEKSNPQEKGFIAFIKKATDTQILEKELSVSLPKKEDNLFPFTLRNKI